MVRSVRFSFSFGALLVLAVFSASVLGSAGKSARALPHPPFAMPTEGFLGACWDDPSPGAQTSTGSNHTGIDVWSHANDLSGTNPGKPVYAVFDGSVRTAALPRIELALDPLPEEYEGLVPQRTGLGAYYTHLSSIRVSAGGRVTKGQLIGYQGNAGTQAVHLHFSIKRGSGSELYIANTWDPSSYFGLELAYPSCGIGTARWMEPFVREEAPPDIVLSPGSAAQVVRAINVPTIPADPDIVFLVDTTTSMGGPIDDVQTNLASILTSVFAQQARTQFAVTEFKDVADGEPEFSVLQGLTSSTNDIQAAIDDLTPLAGGGSDAAEDWINALYQIGSGAVSFRPNSARIVVLLGDSSSHDPSSGRSLQQAIDALVASRARVIAVAVSSPGAIANGLDSRGQASEVVEATNGQLLTIASSSNSQLEGHSAGTGDVTAAILDGLQTLPVTVLPAANGCAPYVTVRWDPPSLTVMSGTTAEFTITIEVSPDVPVGASIECRVDFLLDGVAVSDPVVGSPIVVEVPAPSTSTGDLNCDGFITAGVDTLLLGHAAGQMLPRLFFSTHRLLCRA